MNNNLKLKKQLIKGALAALMLLGGAGTAAAADYVFMYVNGSTYNILSHDGSGALSNVNAFSYTYTVWSGTSGSKFTNLSYNLSLANGGLTAAQNSNTATISSYTIYRKGNGSSTYYLRYNNGWTQSTTSSEATACVYTVSSTAAAWASGSLTVTASASTLSSAGSAGSPSTLSTSATYRNAYYTLTGPSTYYAVEGQTPSGTIPATQSGTITWAPNNTSGWTKTSGVWSNGYVSINETTGLVTYTSYYATDTEVTFKATASASGLSDLTGTVAITFEAPKVDPTGISITSDNPMTVYVGNTGNITYSLTPSPCYNNVTYTSASTGIATVNASGVVTGVATGNTTITVTALKIDGTTTSALTKTVNVTVKNRVATPVITFAPIGDGSTATATITCATAGCNIYYTVNGGTPTASDNPYSAGFTVNDNDIVKAIAVKDPADALWDNSEVETRTYTACSTGDPVITYVPSGSAATVTITAEAGATIYYTTNGAAPTESSTSGTTTVTINSVASGTTVKAFAKNGTCQASATVSKEIIVSNVTDGVVTLYDYEDHNWTYYSGVDAAVDGGNYNTNYLGKLYSPNPRNVKITYNGVNGVSGSSTTVRVSVDENETSFVYYKTLEEGSTSGEYPYQVISNPFSVRPSTGTGNSKVYYGFAGWEIVSGGEYIKGKSNGSVLDLDEEIVLDSLPYSSVNCTSAEIVFQTTWKTANRTYVNSNPSNNQTYSTSGDYESNFYVINCNYTRTITTSGPVTIMMVEPDGSGDYRGTYTFTGNISTNNNGVTKIEWAKWNPSGDVDARGRNLTIGRGLTMGGTTRALVGTGQTSAMNQVLKVESGNFSTFTSYTDNPSSITKHWVVLGCDYDRAKTDNSKLSFTGKFLTGNNRTLGLSSTDEMARVWSKSGSFMTGVSVSDAAADNSYYIGITGNHNNGHRYLEIEGGEWYANIAGGMGEDHTSTEPGFTFRMRGGIIRGSVYGAAAWAGAGGTRTYVITGGTIRGWVAGGANGTSNQQGVLNGASYIYVGGNANINSNGSTSVINRAVGGNVFGAGCGYNATSTSGQVSLGTNVVVADNANIERGVYGGGSYGYCTTTQTSNVYITGGTIDGNAGGVNGTSYLATIDGGVYGGACQNKGGSVNLYVNGGTVNGSVYGGSNYTGVLSGGTNVQLHGGTINGSIYGGGNGKGGETNITTAVTVSVYGGTVTGAVYGCNNVSGAPQSTVTVDVYGTDAAPSANTYAINQVFGGGNQADYGGTPVVTVHCPTDEATPISIGELYGGGNNASVAATNVTVEAGNIIGDVYGGGRLADVTDSTSVTINGGTIRRVFGGNNLYGDINGANAGGMSVTVNKTSSCPMKLGQVFGGGNQAASQVGSISIGCTGTLVSPLADGERYGYDQEGIGAVYGGANNADITGNISLSIVSGIVDSVFGGNNAGGNIDGDITVTINKNGSSACASDWYVGYVFGGGNMAEYSQKTANHPVVKVQAGKVTHHVFGGGNGSGAKVTGNPTVTLSGTAQVGGNVFGGGNAAEVEGNTNVILKN